MAEESFQEKTEEASPKRLAQAREEGNVPKSVEFNSILILFFGVVTLYFLGENLCERLSYGFRIFFQEVGQISLNPQSVHYYAGIGIKSLLSLVAPFVIVVTLIGVVSNVFQVGFMFTLKPITPKFSKINPVSGFKKFFKPKALVDLLKGILKLLIVGYIAYYTLIAYKDKYLLLVNFSIAEIISFIGTVMFKLAVRTLFALLVLAILDLVYQRWQYKRDMRMSKQEVKDEQKQMEGDPLVKGQIKSLQMQRARSRMMQSVPEADVVITNPTELAIALKYDPGNMGAPIVLAKGARLLAQKIKAIATEHSIPIYENKPLARALYKMAEIGREIPYELFQAVAEVFAFVYQLKNRKN